MIERNFTRSRSDKGPDSDFSLEPQEFERLCRDSYDAWLSLGRGGYERQLAEQANRMFRRSIYFVRDLAAGQRVTPEDIRRIRPGHGLQPKFFDSILGRRLKMAVRRGMPTRWEHFED